MVYCYDYNTKNLITTFPGQRIMARELNISRSKVQSIVDKNKPLTCIYSVEDTKHTWILKSILE